MTSSRFPHLDESGAWPAWAATSGTWLALHLDLPRVRLPALLVDVQRDLGGHSSASTPGSPAPAAAALVAAADRSFAGHPAPLDLLAREEGPGNS